MDLVIRAAIAFFFIFLVMRVIGRRELSSLGPFDLILLVVIGDLVQQGVTQDDYSITSIILVVSTIGLLQVAVSFLTYRFNRLRPLLEGEPIVILENGKPIESNLRRERLTVEDVAEEARGQKIASLDDVQWAVLEANGTISFIEKKS
jgi:uncharacterized membrane protein YcaP (DUF421 family)